MMLIRKNRFARKPITDKSPKLGMQLRIRGREEVVVLVCKDVVIFGCLGKSFLSADRRETRRGSAIRCADLSITG